MSELRKITTNKVSYHNDMNKTGIESITSQEVDLFIGICQKLKNKGDQEITLDYSELRQLSGRTRNQKGDFTNFLDNFSDKIGSVNCRIVRYENHNRIIEKFPLFSKFKIDENESTLSIKINHEYIYMFNSIENNFTSFALVDLNSLRNKYAKLLYKLLMQFQTTGFYKVSMQDFRLFMGVPDSYDMRKVTQNVLKPAMADIEKKGLISNLKVKKISNGRGKSITDLEFSFSPEKKQKSPKPSNSSIEYEGLTEDQIEHLKNFY